MILSRQGLGTLFLPTECYSQPSPELLETTALNQRTQEWAFCQRYQQQNGDMKCFSKTPLGRIGNQYSKYQPCESGFCTLLETVTTVMVEYSQGTASSMFTNHHDVSFRRPRMGGVIPQISGSPKAHWVYQLSLPTLKFSGLKQNAFLWLMKLWVSSIVWTQLGHSSHLGGSLMCLAVGWGNQDNCTMCVHRKLQHILMQWLKA